MKKKVALIGSNGQLGTDILKITEKEQSFSIIPLTHKDIEICDKENILRTLDNINPDIILNTAAYNRVDDAEKDPTQAFQINAFATKNLAEYAKLKNIILMHISTDYVFGLDKERKTPYNEDDLPGPVNAYGLSKLTGEYFVKQICSKYFVVRSSGLFGSAQSSSKGYNFIELMIRLAKEKKDIKVVNDQISIPTYTIDLAKQIFTILSHTDFGMYHAAAEGQCSHYEFAKEIFRLTKLSANLNPITSEKFGSVAKRPKYSVLSTEKLKKLGLYNMPDWHEGLKDYLKEKGYI